MTEEVVWPVGRGLIGLDIAFTALMWAACLSNFCLDRKGYDRRRHSKLWRRTYIVAYGMYASTMTYRLWTLGDLPISMFAIAALSLLAIGSIGHGYETIRRVKREDTDRA